MQRKDYLLCRRCEREYPRSGFERRKDGTLNVNRCLACKDRIAAKTRTCASCKQALPIAAFDRVERPSGKTNGHQPRCRECRARIRAYHALPMAERFWPRVERTSSCWLWRGAVFTDGYGVFSYGGKTLRAHRTSWEITNGPIPDGLEVCHDCPGGDNPICVNPGHLFLGTTADNMRDRDAKGRTCRTPGEARWSSKLTESAVIQIRRRYDEGGVTFFDLADEYGVTFQNIWHIVHRKTWQHVT